MVYSNLQSFLKCTTPSVPSQILHKRSLRNSHGKWQVGDKDAIQYFTLEDLWNCYDEWSAYGAGVPMNLNDHESVVQYYTPFLSGIQLYTEDATVTRNLRMDSYLEIEIESTSSDSEEAKLSRTNSNSSVRTWDSDGTATDQEADSKIKERFGKLYFQYFEYLQPHQRLPLRDMVNKLAEAFPGLKTLRSTDLSPASWMAVAWYPIYHIPALRNVKELYSAFLSYHTLSSAFQDDILVERVDDDDDDDSCMNTQHDKDRVKTENNNIDLPPFGLATYKMQRHVWINPETEDHVKFLSLLSAAASWLAQLEVDHHDFSFFLSRYIC